MKRYVHSLLAEYWKFGHTWSAILWLATPLMLLLGHFVAIYLDEGAGYQRYLAFFGHESPWHYLYQSFGYIQALFWPLLTIFLSVSIVSQELKSDMWQHCPVAVHRQLWSKWALLALLIALGLFLGSLVALCSVSLLSKALPLPFAPFQPDTAYLFARFFQLYPLLLAIGTLHFWLSLHSRAHVLLNIALPLVSLPLGNYSPYGMIYQWWSAHTQYLQEATTMAWDAWALHIPLWPAFDWLALLTIVVFHFIGYTTFKRKQSWILSQ